MKKTIIILSILITLLSLNKEEKVVIPENAIRFRVIANSNSDKDQELKMKVVNNLGNNIEKLEYKPGDINESRKYIKNTIPEFKKTIETTLKENNMSKDYKINYGMNYFPEKEYKGTVYKEGKYESLVVTLGDGLGENFWCVLFPPLCLLEAEDEPSTTDIEYKSLIKELIDKYF